MEIDELYNLALKAAIKACEWLKNNQHKLLNKKLKKNPYGGVTKLFDHNAECIIINMLNSKKITILSEERYNEELRDGWPFLIIDPVDGSLNYERGSPLYCVSIAGGDSISECKYEDISFGVIASPYFGIWAFKQGDGVYYNGQKLKKPKLNKISIIRMSPTNTIITTNEVPGRSKLRDIRTKIKYIQLGSTALEFGFLSKGFIDLFVERYSKKIFDFAAGYGILREMGGNCWDFNSQNYNSKRIKIINEEGLVASFFTYERIRGLL